MCVAFKLILCNLKNLSNSIEISDANLVIREEINDWRIGEGLTKNEITVQRGEVNWCVEVMFVKAYCSDGL